MRFSVITSALALAAGANAALSADKVATNVDDLAQMSKDTTKTAEEISIVNSFSNAPQVINGLRDLINESNKDVTAMVKRSQDAESEESAENSKKRRDAEYSDSEQEKICKSFKGFSEDLEKLLQTLIDKHGILSVTPFTSPIEAVLRSLEGTVDTLAYTLIDDVPICSMDATENKQSLDKKLGEAQNEYSSY